MTNFSQELKERRTKRGLTLRAAAKEIKKISFSQLAKYEHGLGLMEMSAGNAQALADFFRWNLRDMLRKMREQAAQQARETAQETTR